MTSQEKQFTIDEITKFNDTDLYRILGLTKDSFTPELAKKKFKKFALKLHPDKNPNDISAKKKFMMLEVAYKILSDSEMKIIYDNAYDDFLADEEEEFVDMKQVDRSKIATVPISEQEFALLLKQKNLVLEPEFTETGKLTDEQMAQKLIEERSQSLLPVEMEQKFKDDVSKLSLINNDEERQKQFNDMFEISKKSQKKKSQSTEVVAYGGVRSLVQTGATSVKYYNTMFSDENTYDDAFELGNDELDDPEMVEGMNFKEYQEQYIAQFATYGELAIKSKLKNGRADFRFDDDEGEHL